MIEVSSSKSWKYVILPVINYFFWLYYSRGQSILSAPLSQNCPTPIPIVVDTPCKNSSSIHEHRRLDETNKDFCDHSQYSQSIPSLESIFSESMTAYKFEQLARMRYPTYTSLLNYHPNTKCISYVNPHVSQKHISQKEGSCLAVVAAQGVDTSLNLLRFDKGPRWGMMSYNVSEEEINPDCKTHKCSTSLRYMPTGFFTKVGSEKGRQRLKEKMGPFLRLLGKVRGLVLNRLKLSGFLPNTGQDITVMVANEGELDLLLNFACSCRQNNISMANVLVFAGSAAVVEAVEKLGVGMMSIYHGSFGAVSKDASKEYLDRTFVDMMWYKAFSVWLLLSLKYNVLFQDVDLVWFREPFSYFREYISNAADSNFGIYPEAFFSDDGQRGLRYSPFYANSGFYYLLHSERTQFFAWTIMTAFDTLHVTGSHQNVFTTKLIENMDLARLSPKLLSLDLFSTGVKFHHDKPFMRGIKEGYEHPFNFHMCWTLNKQNKIDYFKQANMWYLKSCDRLTIECCQPPW